MNLWEGGREEGSVDFKEEKEKCEVGGVEWGLVGEEGQGASTFDGEGMDVNMRDANLVGVGGMSLGENV